MAKKQQYVDFTGEESEKEFLEKVLKQWELIGEVRTVDTMKMVRVGGLMSEIRHRVEDMD